jgi:predicted O-methyltransferase YrrM
MLEIGIRARQAVTYRSSAAASSLLTEIAVRRLRAQDPTLSVVIRALRTPAPGEEEWAARIEGLRREFEASSERLRFDLEEGGDAYWRKAIARSTDPEPPVLEERAVLRTKGEVTRSTSKSEGWGRSLYRIVSSLRPERCLELGTSVGMSACYIGAGLTSGGFGRLITIEGQDDSAQTAREALDEARVSDRVEVRVGQFADVMPGALDDLGGVDFAFIDGHHQYQPTIDYFRSIVDRTANGGLLMFDDIDYPLGDMARAWTEIRADARVTASLTVEHVGLAVVKGSASPHRRLRQLPLKRR